jgi:hypothetical protein
VIDEPVRDVDLAGGGVDRHARGTIERRRALVVARLAGLADLQQELAGAGELEHVRVLRFRRRGGAAPLACRSGRWCRTGGGRGAPAPGVRGARAGNLRRTGRRDPHRAFRVDGNPPGGDGPLEAVAGAAPMTEQRAGGVELEHLRRREAALVGRLRSGRRADFGAGRHRVVAAVHHPDVILRVDRDAGDRAEQPVIGQRPGPQRIDLERGRRALQRRQRGRAHRHRRRRR